MIFSWHRSTKKNSPVQLKMYGTVVRKMGLEPTHESYRLLRPARLPFRHFRVFSCRWFARVRKSYTKVTRPKSRMSTNSIMPAYMSGRKNCRYFYCLLLLVPQGTKIKRGCVYLCLCSILSVILPSLLIFLVALITEPSG